MAEAAELTAPSAVEPRRRLFIPEVEALRGVAALAVVLFHVFATIEPNAKTFETYGSLQGAVIFLTTTIFNGTAAVTLFFVISGFVLSCNVDPAQSIAFPGYSSFVVRRLFRIMPALWGSVVMTVVAWRILGIATYSPHDVYRFFILQDTRINGTFWSLQVELFASFLYPFLLFLSRSLDTVFNGLLLGGLIALSLGNSPFVVMFLYCFHLGLLVPIWGPAMMRALGPAGRRLAFPIALGLLVIPVQLSRLGYMNSREHLLFEAVASFYLLSHILYAASSRTRNWLGRPRVRWLGQVSYSLYVIHYPVSSLAFVLIQWQLGRLWTDDPVICQLIALPFVLFGSLGLAWLGYRLIERPCHGMGRAVARRLIEDMAALSRMMRARSSGAGGIGAVRPTVRWVSAATVGLTLALCGFLGVKIVTAALKL